MNRSYGCKVTELRTCAYGLRISGLGKNSTSGLGFFFRSGSGARIEDRRILTGSRRRSRRVGPVELTGMVAAVAGRRSRAGRRARRGRHGGGGGGARRRRGRRRRGTKERGAAARPGSGLGRASDGLRRARAAMWAHAHVAGGDWARGRRRTRPAGADVSGRRGSEN